jgi:hypothetical protein
MDVAHCRAAEQLRRLTDNPRDISGCIDDAFPLAADKGVQVPVAIPGQMFGLWKEPWVGVTAGEDRPSSGGRRDDETAPEAVL